MSIFCWTHIAVGHRIQGGRPGPLRLPSAADYCKWYYFARFCRNLIFFFIKNPSRSNYPYVPSSGIIRIFWIILFTVFFSLLFEKANAEMNSLLILWTCTWYQIRNQWVFEKNLKQQKNHKPWYKKDFHYKETVP